MAQAGYTPLSLYYSTTALAAPTAGNLINGELGLNITDGKLYYKDNLGVVQLLASKAAASGVTTFSAGTTGLTPNSATGGAVTLAGTLNVANGGTGLTSLTAGSMVYGAGTSAYSTLAIGTNGYILQSNGTAPTWVNPTTVVGGAGGANTQVQYNNSGALAGSANFTFDGTNIGLAGGTANGVAYLNGSKVLTTGSALTFDGTNLGVGTTSPTRLVQAQNTSGNPFISIYGGASSIGGLLFDKAAGAYGQIRYDNSTDDMWFTTNNTEKMRLDSSGRLLIGTTTASGSDLLQVNSDALVNGLTVGLGGGAVASNTAVGSGALTTNSTGAENVAFGVNALALNTSGTGNAALGTYALSANTGSYNVAIGRSALVSNTTASNNTAVGYQAGYSNTTGTRNNILGYKAGYSNSTNNDLTAFGDQAATSTAADYNTAIGSAALFYNTSGAANTVLGAGAMFGSSGTSTGSNNTAIGRQALSNNTTADNNTAVGYQAGYSNTTGTTNTAVGCQALYSNTTSDENTAVGYQAGYTATGLGLAIFGKGAGYYLSTGNNNTFIGSAAGYYATTGSQNTFVGVNAGISGGAGGAVTTGSYNTIIGGYSGNNGGLDIRTASNYIVLSDGAGNPQVFVDASGNTWFGTLGQGASNNNGGTVITGPGASSGQMGMSHPTGTASGVLYTSFGYGATTIGSVSQNGTTGVLYNTSSDYRLKENVTPIANGLDAIKALNPVTFDWISDGSEDSGFIAHEFQAVIPRSVTGTKDAVDEEGNPVYQAMDSKGAIPFLVAAIKELSAKNDALEARLTALEAK